MEAPAFRLLAAVALVLAFVTGLVKRWWRRSKYDVHRIPGPPAYPVVGNMPQILSLKKPQMHLLVHEWTKEYGKVVKVETGVLGGLALHVSDPEFVQNNVVGHGTRGMPKSPFYNHFRQLVTPEEEGYFFTDLTGQEYWKAVRKSMAKAFSTTALKATCPKVARKVDEFVDLIKKKPPTEPIEFQHLLVRLMFDAIGVGGFGIDFKALQNENHPGLKAVDYCSDETAASISSFRRFVKWAFPWCKLAQESKKMYSQMYDFYNMIMKDMRGRGEPAADDLSLSACLLRIKDPKTRAPLNDALLSAEIGAFIIGGTDTSSHELTWALLAIATHPEAQQKIVDELKTSGVLQQIREGGADRVSYSDLMGLQYLGMAVKEAIRMFPVAPSGSFRTTPEDGMRVCGYRVPKGTVVIANVHSMGNSPIVWDDPDAYRPERWRKVAVTEQLDTEFDSEPSTKSDPRRLWAFSDGPKNCIGQRLALMQMQLVVAVLLAHFELRLAERMGSWEEALSRQALKLVLLMDGGLWLNCHPRQHLEQ